MKHTLVAAFATLVDANRTRADLMSRGIPREQIHAVGAESAEIHAYDAPYSTTTDTPVDRTHHESKVAHFFKSLFGNEPHEEHRRHATAYPDAVRRGALVIAVDVLDDDQLVSARDALEYNGAIDISERNADGSRSTDTAAAHGYAGPTSPYAGATGGDSHLDKHFTRPTSGARATSGTATGAMASGERYSESEPPRAGGPIGSATGSGRTSDSTSTGYGDRSSGDTGRYDVGGAAKRAGTDYPGTAATTNPTGGGIAGQGASAGAVGATGASTSTGTGTGTSDSTQHGKYKLAGTCSDRVCVIRRHDEDSGLG